MTKNEDKLKFFSQDFIDSIKTISLVIHEDDRNFIDIEQKKFEPVFEEFINFNKDKPFFLAPNSYNYILSILPKYFQELKDQIDTSDSLEQWELKHISAILGKALIPDSIATPHDNAKTIANDIAEKFKDDAKSRILIRELCTGAGLSTMLTYFEIKKKSKNPFTIIGTDNALESILTASIMMNLFNIPHIIVSSEITPAITQFDGVVLQYMGVTPALKNDILNKLAFDYVLSDNGISYFSNPIHSETIDDIIKVTKANGMIVICSLEPDVKINLNYFAMVKGIILYGGKAQEVHQKIRDERRADFEKTGKGGDSLLCNVRYTENYMEVREYLSAQAAGTYGMLHAYLFKKKFFSIKNFRQYIKTLSSITKAARELGGEIQSPVRFSKECFDKFLTEDKFEFSFLPPLNEGRKMLRTLQVRIK